MLYFIIYHPRVKHSTPCLCLGTVFPWHKSLVSFEVLFTSFPLTWMFSIICEHGKLNSLEADFSTILLMKNVKANWMHKSTNEMPQAISWNVHCMHGEMHCNEMPKKSFNTRIFLSKKNATMYCSVRAVFDHEGQAACGQLIKNIDLSGISTMQITGHLRTLLGWLLLRQAREKRSANDNASTKMVDKYEWTGVWGPLSAKK